MNSKLDKYFRDKVHDHGTQPSAAAWEKVEARLSKKNSTVVTLRIAAAIALIGLATVVILDQAKTTEAPVVVKKQPVQVAPATESDANTTTPPAQVATNETHTTPSQRPTSSNKKSIHEKNTEGQATIDRDFLVMEAPVVEQAEVKAEIQPEKAKAKRIVIVYTLPTINKTQALTPAQAEEEKRTGLQKVMDVAMDMRATEIPLGELREAKDDLFALEFRKDKKTKNQ